MLGIRADANGVIATGHVMRCLSIATQMKKMDEDILFIVSEDAYTDRIRQAGFEVCVLGNKYNEKESEIDRLKSILQERGIHTLLVDSYEVTQNYLEEIHKLARLIYIDDMNVMSYPVDVIVNYTYGVSISDYEKWEYSDGVKIYTGMAYVPLREQFVGRKISIGKETEGLFITSGGSDPFDIIRRILLSLETTQMKGLNKHIVIGSFYEHEEWLREYVAINPNVFVYKNISDMADVMVKCDIAISAGGTTLAELCACGIPTVAFSMADNQMAGAKSFGDDGLVLYVGDIRDGICEKTDAIIQSVKNLCDNIEFREQMSLKQSKKIDGYGAYRIAKVISSLHD